MIREPDRKTGQEWALEGPVSAPIADIRRLIGEVPPVMSRNAQNVVNL